METDDFDNVQAGKQMVQARDSTEKAFRDTEVPPWTMQITVRSMVTSFFLSIIFNFIVCKLNLTTGVIPSLNVAAGLLGFALLKGYTALLQKLGLLKQPFTRQENTVVQTCVVASSGIAFSSGTASYLLGMSPQVAAQGDAGNTLINIKRLSIPWMTGYLFTVSFAGLFSIIALREMMILKRKLTYPSGTATAHLINSFHTPKGARMAARQVSALFKSCCGSFVWSFFQWFFAASDGCGFASFPIFGLKAYKQRFYFDFSTTYIGCGMITSYMVNISMLVGAVISWGIMWPLIEQKKGIWYGAHLSASSLHGIQGYRVFISIGMILGDGLYHVINILIKNLFRNKSEEKKVELASPLPPPLSLSNMEAGGLPSSETELSENYDEERRTEYFLKDQIPLSVAVAGYIALAGISIIVLPFIFHQLKWYHVLTAYLIAPVLAFCNAYGCGLTDWSLASNYGKIAILIFSAWVGLEKGGVIAGLASCGAMMSIVSTASDLMQDFKTGYLTLSSPRSMFFSQVFGTAMGCVMSPLIFWFFYKAYRVGDPTGSYPAPYGLMYRGIALLGVEGFGSLPKHCVTLAVSFFAFAIAINIVTELLKRYETKYKIYRFVPNAMAMAVPFYLGSYFVIDMCLGSLVLFCWKLWNKKQAEDLAPAVASGLICGESMWGVPAAILSLANVKAPICMKFLSYSDNDRVDSFLSSSGSS
ncbi:probable metal-nicotianamine transporter YSL7 [Rosa chinensis]|uniref:probable metal-nicotianamine transporter YSL7 n=1 Tax=Rosa chinensis TaxID=74649 RepID=UPI000D096FC3|nr:probable metal-nicotianamine transporter YSL7 [Rosa chinensis]